MDRNLSGADSASLLRACSLLMEAIALHSVSRDHGTYATFRDAVREHRRSTETADSADPVLIATGAVIQLLETNNRDVENFIRTQTKELQEMVRMLSQTLIAITQESAQAGENLSHIEKELESASRVDDLRLLKTRLQDSLQSIVKESTRQKNNTLDVASRLRNQLENVQIDADSLDSVTGLPDAAAAEHCLARAVTSCAQGYAAVLCMERLDAINSRFGYAVGDRLMFQFAQEVAQRLSGWDKLFRWRGPTLIAILERPGRPQDVRNEVGHIVAAKREHLIDIGGRTVLLPMAARFAVISLRETPTLDAILDTVNSFVTSMSS
jgi:GGDEF domain-containing protein